MKTYVDLETMTVIYKYFTALTVLNITCQYTYRISHIISHIVIKKYSYYNESFRE